MKFQENAKHISWERTPRTPQNPRLTAFIRGSPQFPAIPPHGRSAIYNRSMRYYCTAVCLGCALSLLSGCYPQTAAGPADATLRRVDVVELHEEPVADPVTLIGSIEPWRETVLYFEVAGVVSEVFVEEGDQVEPKTPVAQLVLDDFQFAASRADAELAAAQAKLDRLLTGTRKEDLEVAQADYARAQVRSTYWTTELARSKRLFSNRAISASDLDRVQREHDSADQQQRWAKARLDRAIEGPRKEDKDAATAAVEAQKQAAALAGRQLQKATLSAPFGGRIEKRLLDAGAYVNVFPTGGVPVVHLVDLTTVDAVVAVPEALMPHFADKSHVEIVSAVDTRIRAQGEVIALGQVADRASGTYELRVRFSNAKQRFTGGMVVTARALRESSRRAFRVPLTALCRAYGQKPYLLLVDPKHSRVVAREVQLGPIAGRMVEISEGLSGGELLIVRGQDRIVPGDRVKYELADAMAPVATPPAEVEGPEK